MPDTSTLILASFLIFLATTPWINRNSANRPLGLATIFLSFAGFYHSYLIIKGQILFPSHCWGRRSYLCELETLLFDLGGEYLAATPALSIALLFFVGGSFMAIRR